MSGTGKPLLERVRRRRIVQWGLAYLAGAWLVIQVLDVVGGAWGWDPQLFRVLQVVLAMGFLVALVLAWYHGELGRQDVTGGELAVLALILAVGGVVITRLPSPTEGDASPTEALAFADDRPCVAVLPLRAIGEAPDVGRGDAVQEQILHQLAQLSSLRVISRTSTLRYRETMATAPEIGRELGCDHVMEGSFQPSSEGTLYTIQLIDARSDAHVWSQQIEHTPGSMSVFELQRGIAAAAAARLASTLTPEDSTALASPPPTEDPQAYEALVQGRIAWDVDDYRGAAEHFRRATVIDPGLGVAFALLAYAEVTRFWRDAAAPALDSARTALGRARTLAPDAHETVIAEGALRYYGFRDYDGALPSFRRASALRPNDALSAALIGYIHRRRGEWDDAVAWQERAIRLDPFSFRLSIQLANTYRGVRRYATAVRLFERAVRIAPTASEGYHEWFHLTVETGDTAAARQIVDAAEASGVDARVLLEPRWLLAHLSRDYDRALSIWGIPDTSDPVELERAMRTAHYGYVTRTLHAMGDRERLTAVADTLRVRWLRSDQLRGPAAGSPLGAGTAYCSLALAQAALGHADEAISSALKAFEVLPRGRDAISDASHLECLAEIYAMTGRNEDALSTIEELFAMPSFDFDVGLLELTPIYDGLRSDPAFRALVHRERAELDAARVAGH